jgi:putative peptidoglycan lipid II flippase
MALDLNKKLKGIELKKMWNNFLKILFSSSIMGITLYFVNKFAMVSVGTVDEMKGSLISLIISFVLGSVIYFVCLYFVKIEEFKYLIESIRTKIVRKKA